VAGAREERNLVGLVLVAAVGVLAAVAAGRAGATALATAALGVAASAGVISFGLALAATVRAARRTSPAPRRGGEGS